MSEIKCLDQKGIDFITNEEGLVLHPYLDSVGIPTIGYGFTYYPGSGKKVTLKDKPITKQQAQDIFKQIIVPYETAVWSVTRDDITQNQFSALCSLCYNIGVNGFKSSTVVKRVNKSPLDPKIADAFLLWKKPAVLIGRRKREIELYFS